VVGRGGFFALSFGSIVGSGWIVLLGEWLRLAAPAGALLALLAGGMLMAAIGLCYAELAARMPRAGAELRYVADTLGPKAAFPVGWFLTLFLVAICAFEGTALPWLLGLLLPVRAAPLYRFLGEPVTGWGLSMGCLGAAAICIRSSHSLRGSSTASSRSISRAIQSGAMRGNLIRAEMKVIMGLMSTQNEVPPVPLTASGVATVTMFRAIDGVGNVSVRIDRKPVLPVDGPPHRCESRKQILLFHAADLRHCLALRAHNGEIVLLHPQHALKQPLPLQNLSRPHFEYVARHVVDIFRAAKFRFVNRQQFFHQNEGLDIAYIGEIFFGQLEILQGENGPADNLLGALLCGRENDVAHFAVLARHDAALAHFLHRHALPVSEMIARPLRLAFHVRRFADQIGRRLLRAHYRGAHHPRC